MSASSAAIGVAARVATAHRSSSPSASSSSVVVRLVSSSSSSSSRRSSPSRFLSASSPPSSSSSPSSFSPRTTTTAAAAAVLADDYLGGRRRRRRRRRTATEEEEEEERFRPVRTTLVVDDDAPPFVGERSKTRPSNALFPPASSSGGSVRSVATTTTTTTTPSAEATFGGESDGGFPEAPSSPRRRPPPRLRLSRRTVEAIWDLLGDDDDGGGGRLGAIANDDDDDREGFRLASLGAGSGAGEDDDAGGMAAAGGERRIAIDADRFPAELFDHRDDDGTAEEEAVVVARGEEGTTTSGGSSGSAVRPTVEGISKFAEEVEDTLDSLLKALEEEEGTPFDDDADGASSSSFPRPDLVAEYYETAIDLLSECAKTYEGTLLLAEEQRGSRSGRGAVPGATGDGRIEEDIGDDDDGAAALHRPRLRHPAERAHALLNRWESEYDQDCRRHCLASDRHLPFEYPPPTSVAYASVIRGWSNCKSIDDVRDARLDRRYVPAELATVALRRMAGRMDGDDDEDDEGRFTVGRSYRTVVEMWCDPNRLRGFSDGLAGGAREERRQSQRPRRRFGGPPFNPEKKMAVANVALAAARTAAGLLEEMEKVRCPLLLPPGEKEAASAADRPPPLSAASRNAVLGAYARAARTAGDVARRSANGDAAVPPGERERGRARSDGVEEEESGVVARRWEATTEAAASSLVEAAATLAKEAATEAAAMLLRMEEEETEDRRRRRRGSDDDATVSTDAIVVRNVPSPDGTSYKAVIDAHSNVPTVEGAIESERILRRAEEEELQRRRRGEKAELDVACYGAVLHAYARTAHLVPYDDDDVAEEGKEDARRRHPADRALDLLTRMERRAFGARGGGDDEVGRRGVGALPPAPDAVCYGAMINAFARTRPTTTKPPAAAVGDDPKESPAIVAQSILERMESLYSSGRSRCRPNVYCYGNAVSAWFRHRRDDMAMATEQSYRLLKRIETEYLRRPIANGKRRWDRDTESALSSGSVLVWYNSVLHLHALGDDDNGGGVVRPDAARRAEDLLVGMERTGTPSPDVRSYRSVIVAHARSGGGGNHSVVDGVRNAWAVLRRMADRRRERSSSAASASVAPRPNDILYNTILNACANVPRASGEDDKAEVVRIAFEAFDELTRSSSSSSSPYVDERGKRKSYGKMVEVCTNLLSPGRPERDDAIEGIFRRCVEDGSVDENFVTKLRYGASRDLLERLLGSDAAGKLRNGGGAASEAFDLPEGWTSERRPAAGTATRPGTMTLENAKPK